MDETMSSSDPLQAFLLDAQCIRRWLQRTLQVTKARVVSALGHGLGADGALGSLSRAVSELAALDAVAVALETAVPGDGAAAADGREVQRVLQAARAGLFVARAGFGGRPPPNFASEAEWKGLVGRRRAALRAGPEASSQETLLCADAATDLTLEHGVESGVAYPTPALDGLVHALFLSGDTGTAAYHAKSRFLFLHLVDGGWCTRQQALEHLR